MNKLSDAGGFEDGDAGFVKIPNFEVVWVYHEKHKDQYHPEHNDWTYSIRGKTVDGKDIRIAVAFDENSMLIITAIEITRGIK